jgi:hypothetical protein
MKPVKTDKQHKHTSPRDYDENVGNQFKTDEWNGHTHGG